MPGLSFTSITLATFVNTESYARGNQPRPYIPIWHLVDGGLPGAIGDLNNITSDSPAGWVINQDNAGLLQAWHSSITRAGDGTIISATDIISGLSFTFTYGLNFYGILPSDRPNALIGLYGNCTSFVCGRVVTGNFPLGPEPNLDNYYGFPPSPYIEPGNGGPWLVDGLFPISNIVPLSNFTVSLSYGPPDFESLVSFQLSDIISDPYTNFLPYTFEWEFSDGYVTPAYAGISLSHSFPTTRDPMGKLWWVALKITDAIGRYTVNWKKFEFIQNPIAQIDITSHPTLFDYYFTGINSKAFGAGNHIVSWEWDFGDLNTDTGVTTEEIFPFSGVYVVTLKVTDIHGLTGSTTKTITISSKPTLLYDQNYGELFLFANNLGGVESIRMKQVLAFRDSSGHFYNRVSPDPAVILANNFYTVSYPFKVGPLLCCFCAANDLSSELQAHIDYFESNDEGSTWNPQFRLVTEFITYGCIQSCDGSTIFVLGIDQNDNVNKVISIKRDGESFLQEMSEIDGIEFSISFNIYKLFCIHTRYLAVCLTDTGTIQLFDSIDGCVTWSQFGDDIVGEILNQIDISSDGGFLYAAVNGPTVNDPDSELIIKLDSDSFTTEKNPLHNINFRTVSGFFHINSTFIAGAPGTIFYRTDFVLEDGRVWNSIPFP